jgi:ProP effector
MSLAARRALAAYLVAIIARLERLWPRCFVVYEGRRRPLKLGIDRDVIAQCQQAIDKGLNTVKDLRRALRHYVGNTNYLKACGQGVGRVDLDGRIVGVVTADEARHAREVLRQRRAKRANDSSPARRDISLQPAGSPHVEKERPSANPQFAKAMEGDTLTERMSRSGVCSGMGASANYLSGLPTAF